MRRKSFTNVARDFGNRAGHFHPGRAPPTITKVSSRRRSQDRSRPQPAPDAISTTADHAQRVLDTLEPRRRPIRHARNRNASPRSRGPDNQRSARRRSSARAWRGIGVDLGHQHRGVALPAQDVPDRPRDLGRRERRGRDLIQQGLETMVVMPIEHDIDRRVAALWPLPARRSRRRR